MQPISSHHAAQPHINSRQRQEPSALLWMLQQTMSVGWRKQSVHTSRLSTSVIQLMLSAAACS